MICECPPPIDRPNTPPAPSEHRSQTVFPNHRHLAVALKGLRPRRDFRGEHERRLDVRRTGVGESAGGVLNCERGGERLPIGIAEFLPPTRSQMDFPRAVLAPSNRTGESLCLDDQGEIIPCDEQIDLPSLDLKIRKDEGPPPFHLKQPHDLAQCGAL